MQPYHRSFFFFNDTATTEIYTLSLHDALPISLPEAQLDRFFFKLKVMYPPEEAMHRIIERTTQPGESMVSRVVDGPEILEMRQVARAVHRLDRKSTRLNSSH